jgi:hypothetical protein
MDVAETKAVAIDGATIARLKKKKFILARKAIYLISVFLHPNTAPKVLTLK